MCKVQGQFLFKIIFIQMYLYHLYKCFNKTEGSLRTYFQAIKNG